MKYKKFWEPILKADVMVVGDCTPEELAAFLKKRKLPNEGHEYYGRSL